MRTPHQNLLESFPDLADTFHHLKRNQDHHFKHLLTQYDTFDSEVNKIDNGNAVDQIYFDELKKKRVVAKDAIYQYMQENKI